LDDDQERSLRREELISTNLVLNRLDTAPRLPSMPASGGEREVMKLDLRRHR